MNFPKWGQVVGSFNTAWENYYGSEPPALDKGASSIAVIDGYPSTYWQLVGVDGKAKARWSTTTNGIVFL